MTIFRSVLLVMAIMFGISYIQEFHEYHQNGDRSTLRWAGFWFGLAVIQASALFGGV